jgi:CheY-like chemotaxis protein
VASDESRVTSKEEAADHSPLTTHHSHDHSPFTTRHSSHHSSLTTHHLILSVKDSGVGIAAEHLPRIFELFAQVGAVSRRSQEGLGIGLALVRGLVELHGGSVEARSEGVGKGSEFLVRLPIAAAVEEKFVEHPGDETVPSIASSRKRILVVDDNRVQSKSLAILLEYSGHEVKAAHDGPSAMAILEDFVPDIALIDVGLPHGMSGHDLARQMRAQQRFNNTLLIAQTGWGRDEDRERSQAAGFNYHLVKPIDHDQLQRIIDGDESH